jgi:hypothetical protein
MFATDSNAKTHAMVKHGKCEPDEPIIPAWPAVSKYTPLRDVEGKIIPG